MATRRGIEPLPSDRQSGTLPLRQWANLYSLYQFFVGVNYLFQGVIDFFVGIEDFRSVLTYNANGMTKALH